MTSMAAEMAARMAAEGNQAQPQGAPAAAGGVPGNEGGNAPQAAEPSNTDTGAQGGSPPPDTIPYARFKEVNDRYNDLKPFEQLREFGYSADSLQRLAAFEATYQQDPVGTWAAMADNLDLPQELKDSLKQHFDAAAASTSSGSAEGAPSGGSNATPLELPPDVKERLEYVDKLRAREEQNAQEAQLGRVMAAWDGMDKQDGIETPERIKLMAIASFSGSTQPFATVEDLARAARESINEFRGSVLGGAVIRTDQRGLPPALPGSPPVASPAVSFGSDIKAASKAAQAAIERGEIPGIGA